MTTSTTRATSEALNELLAMLPPGVVATTAESIDSYRQDFARDGSAGHPAAVVRPESVDQVQTVLRWANRYKVAIVPRGAGTGLSGGSSAVDGAVTICLERMRGVKIDPVNQIAVVEPGALNAEVKAAAAKEGLWYPPDPSSFEICSIGGNIATNAGGLCCHKYGVTADYVLGIDVVLADGTLVSLGGRTQKDVAGLPLVKLFVGSEGILGVITGAILRLLPTPPPPGAMVATFATVSAASRAVLAIRGQTRASMLELIDRTTINAIEDWRSHGLDRSSGALLIAQSDAPGSARDAELELMADACEAEGAAGVFCSSDPADVEMFVAARRAALHALERTGSVMLEDVSVPVPLLPELVEAVAEISQHRETEIAIIAHAGDGNTHPVIVFDASDTAATHRARAAFEDVMATAIALGGTITGEHGVGRTKSTALPSQLGAHVMDLNWRVKDALDPGGLLNPGAVLVRR